MIGVPEKLPPKSFSATESNLLVLRVEDLVGRSIFTTRDQLYRRSLHRSTYGLSAFHNYLRA